jgi:hypothetical protein
MSFTAVRSYFRTRLDGLGEDLSEWRDGFNFENIPDTVLDRAYHIESGPYTGNQQNQSIIDASAAVTVRVFLKGYLDPAEAIDNGIDLGQTIICDIVNPINANGSLVKNVDFSSMAIEPYDQSNDNDAILIIEFSIRLFIKTV